MMYFSEPSRRKIQSANSIVLNLTERDMNKHVIYGPYDTFSIGRYLINFRFNSVLFEDKNKPCIKIEVFMHEKVSKLENSYSHNDLSIVNNHPHFNISINSASTIEFRIIPLCVGKIDFNQIDFIKLSKN